MSHNNFQAQQLDDAVSQAVAALDAVLADFDDLSHNAVRVRVDDIVSTLRAQHDASFRASHRNI